MKKKEWKKRIVVKSLLTKKRKRKIAPIDLQKREIKRSINILDD